MNKKYERPIIYGTIAIVAIAGFWFTREEPPATGSKRPTPRLGASQSTAEVPDGFTQADFDAEFPALNESLNNAFKPVVARSGSGYGGSGLAPNEVPASYTGGEPGWFYTGTAIIDDVPTALMENASTSEGLFLKVGEKLRKATIIGIAPTYIQVRGVGGQTLTLDLLADPLDPDEEIEGIGFQPVVPDMSELLNDPRFQQGGNEGSAPPVVILPPATSGGGGQQEQPGNGDNNNEESNDD